MPFPIGDYFLNWIACALIVLGSSCFSFVARAAEQPRADVLQALQQALEGYIAVSFPAENSNRCTVELSGLKKISDEVHEAWFSVMIESVCPDAASSKDAIWFRCTRRGGVRCLPSFAPSENNQ